MRILVVALSDSIHTARWLAQVGGQNWDIHLFPSIDNGILHGDIKNITVHNSFYSRQSSKHQNVRFHGLPVYYDYPATFGRKLLKNIGHNYRAVQLERLIRRLMPDVVHSLEIQHAGYLTLEAKKLVEDNFPPWIVTNWGSDIFLFGRLAEHRPKIEEVLKECDFYSCECSRDVSLARSYGYKGTVLPVFPNTGGFDLESLSRLRRPGPVSGRRTIALKGYQHWAGRALVGLRALERCADILEGYEVIVHTATDDVILAALLFEESTGVPVTVIPAGTPHKEILRMHGHARVSIGLSISDAISTSLLEAMVMGSFPVQSWTACADEWIVDGETGILVPPEDPEVVEVAMRRALADDELVNSASERNWRIAVEKLESSTLRQKAIDMYKTAIGGA